MLLPLSVLRLDGGTQARVSLSLSAIDDLADLLQEDPKWNPPAIVVYRDGEQHWLADGFHRVRAHEKVGRKKILAEVREGTLRDAILYSLGANAHHGVRRTTDDVRKAIATILADEEWRQMSHTEIGKVVGIHRATVSRIRQELEPPPPEPVAESHTVAGCDSMDGAQPTGSAQTEPAKSPDVPSADQRKYIHPRTGKETTMNVANIKKAAKERGKKTEPEAEAASAPQVLRDSIGLPVPESLREVFAVRQKFERALALRQELANLLSEIAKEPGGEFLARELTRKERTSPEGKPLSVYYRAAALDDLKLKLEDTAPTLAACPWCEANPVKPGDKCLACYNAGWIPRMSWRGLEEEDRKLWEAKGKEASQAEAGSQGGAA